MAKDLLDLHGFKTDEVFDAVDNFIMSVNQNNLKRARIMTGKGTGVVKKVVIDYLKQAKYPWQYEKLSNGKNNEGVLVVFLD
ncbi:MAG: Smr/MutS family protein [Oligoflexia bacterium]|nr:Smr/MutS family protein [Oligoflexia bacterium]